MIVNLGTTFFSMNIEILSNNALLHKCQYKIKVKHESLNPVKAYAFVHVCLLCLVVNCWEMADLWRSFVMSNCEFVTFPLVS